MPSTDEVERSQNVLNVASRCLRSEPPQHTRHGSRVVGFSPDRFVTSVLPAVSVAAVILVTGRVPVIRATGTYRLRTDDDVEAVVEEFTGPTPSVLVPVVGHRPSYE
jgi:hypothetical protein